MQREARTKRTHASVGYVHPSKHEGEHCGVCAHYVPGKPPACTGVQSPIRAEDYCERFKKKG